MATLYVSDLDGTLIRDDLTLSAEARRDLRALLDEGTLITVASARSVTSIRAILGTSPSRSRSSSSTGLPLRVPDGEARGRERYPGAHRPRGLLRARGRGCEPYISSFDGTRDLVYYRRIANEGMPPTSPSGSPSRTSASAAWTTSRPPSTAVRSASPSSNAANGSARCTPRSLPLSATGSC